MSSSNQADNMAKSKFVCKTCLASFDDEQAMIKHWQTEFAEGNRHYHCVMCMQEFRTLGGAETHRKQMHPIDQKLVCPGCKVNFTRLGGFIDHIEKNLCQTISNEKFHDQREKALSFARKLQMLPGGADFGTAAFTAGSTKSGGPSDYTQWLSATKEQTTGGTLSSVRPLVTTGHKPDPVSFQMLSLEQKDDLLTGPGSDHPEQQSDIGDMKVLFPSYEPPARNSVGDKTAAPARPTPVQAQGWREPQKRPTYDRHDPRNPSWDPKEYWNQWTRKYKCPRDKCAKAFPTSNGLRNHILNHSRTEFRVQCPVCSKWFDTNAALAQHAESEGSWCKIRESDEYGHFLGQFTAGMVDTKIGEEGVNVYTVSAQADKTFGDKKEDKKANEDDDGWGQ
ncbi:hypothetical protein QBC40DRAFT_346345 [Triangularia verruculosa]|uniref:C2H2-type domain-containing protein n=1 Tax=Triangularia verruculosa TaxID=2587418 RepID=A0AAN7AZT1_9PEZI|nr:hypothetical protein QBC40DRAFT_346345 [Triangularia verruculosa]